MADDDLDAGGESRSQYQPDKKQTPAEQAAADLLVEIRQRYDFARSVESRQRQAERDELDFEVDPWLAADRRNREEPGVDPVSGNKIPPRPALSINLIDQPIQQVVGEARAARLSVTIKPKAGLATTKQAGYYQGLIRAIQADSGALSVRLWAHERTAKVGRGAYRIVTEYAEDGDFDLDITLKRILDQASVFWDPFAIAADRSDAEWCMIRMPMTEEERLRLWDDKPITAAEDSWVDDEDGWFIRDEHDVKTVTVMEYWRVHHKTRQLVHLPDRGPTFLDQMPPEFQESMARIPDLKVREVDVRTIWQHIVDGTQILEQHQWIGRFIPIIPTVGKEYVVRGERGWKGMIRDVMDACRGYNVAMSSAVELAGTAPRAPYLMYAGQDEGFEEMWDDSPIKHYTRLYVNPMMVGDKPAPLPQRQQTEPQIQAVMFLARSLKEDVNIQLGAVSAIVRAVNPNERSGKAIEALQRQGAAGTSNYLDNLATISMPHEGRVLIDLIPKVYDREGRIIQVMASEGEDETAIMLKVPFVADDEGQPVPIPCPACQGQKQVTITKRTPAWNPIGTRVQVPCPACQGKGWATKKNMPPEWQGKPVEYVDLAEGTFKVQVSVGRSFQSKQEEALAGMLELAKAVPQTVPLYMDILIRAMGFPWSNEIADRVKQANPLLKGQEGDQKIPPQVQQAFEALKQEHQAALAELQKATEALRTDAVKQAGQKEIAAMKLEAAETIEHLKQQGKLMEQAAAASGQQEIEQVRGMLEQLRQEAEQRHEVLLAVLEQKGDLALERLEQAGEARQAERAARVQAAAEARQAGREDALEAREPPE